MTRSTAVIHATAIIEPGAQLGADCEVHAHAIVRKHSLLADRVVVHPFAVVGGDPQYLKFDPATESGVKIGSGTVIREHVTVNRSIHAGEFTTVGEGCFLMASSHLGHDCVLGNQVVLANAVLLAGHVAVGDHAFLGGGAAVHQFCRIGDGVMIGGHASITRDIAPYLMVAERDAVAGFNVVGLKRRGLSRESIGELKRAFHAVFFTPGNIRSVAAETLATGGFQTAEARRFLEFFSEGKRSFARPRRGSGGEVAAE
ncbi:acyl-ACP--UDP-N-acetylglucosamine O-acyltransferase [Opitutus terrae]|uniref:Acyl-(Acyl-carrier-protein)--UDP-N-acetylglucosamine O-acyltransferase n=1 Tax=Opitutus terrae (strain DSM 11246 / JCM 15787 / PB90-1) TaxID=452637 RepID=B1ZQS4_OPITP|nr:acyl-ACP--UDP-N-acetylglucosamine O-acyltransferase [Opitutus terrae]ACB77825.1 acyl-(acyl-carrier-protein)--UDP-N-acetylglucosamine O-acyltransferase [Opitutus terrae PB90-1]